MAIPRIKICGIQNLQEARLCLRNGADSLGFLLELTHKAEDKVTTEQAKAIIRQLPPDVNTVMVTHSLDWNRIVEVAKETGVKAIQIHDDLPIDDIKRVRAALPETTLLKAVHVPSAEVSTRERDAAIDKAKQYAHVVDALLLDSRTKDRLGGTGVIHDWDTSRRIVQEVEKPVILAGGLNSENVLQSIETVHPFGVDLNSGVEDKNGKKAPSKVRAYCQAARRGLNITSDKSVSRN